MTNDDILNISRDALFSNGVVPAEFFILCVFMGAVTSTALKHGKFAVTFLGVIFATPSLYAGLTYTVMPLWIFALMLGCGFLAGLKPERARTRR